MQADKALENTGSKYDSSITGSFLCKVWKHQKVAPWFSHIDLMHETPLSILYENLIFTKEQTCACVVV
jgi:hypothetical protein